ncbi:MAG: hypothetical protein L0H79_06360 [Intrasporangium sp.]|uniref:hypothetical protein n=1 Tax=Intrasporangium sp. TaxID=1925024 RepID=UPI002649D2FC|nr:hypothetical protein [Intrasporangium sp.]MDN5795360.1 hypothetical protein [Intrasporangium sp.]
MADPTEPATTAGQRFLINVIGLAGIVYGGLAIVYYLLGFGALSFAAAPYRWLQLEGLVRYVPPLIVFVVCFVIVWAVERRAARSAGR